MKIALVTDQHFGCRGDSLVFDSFFREFYESTFFPTLKERGITKVVDLGDTFDRRKFINFKILDSCKAYYFDKLAENGLEEWCIVGNHCTFYRNTNKINSPDLVLAGYPNIHVVSGPQEIEFDGTPILFVPWICDDNYNATMALLKSSRAQILFGHLEINGFEMYRGQPNVHGGMDPNVFNRFDIVYSGHFHHRSTKGNITYLGNPYEITWADYDDQRGFHIFDTETRELEFIPNPHRMFFKIIYNDQNKLINWSNIDTSIYAGKFVKVVVERKTDIAKFDKFIDRLYNVSPTELKIIENISEYDDTLVDQDKVDVEDTVTMLDHYVDALETDLDKTRIKGYLRGLYNEAQALED